MLHRLIYVAVVFLLTLQTSSLSAQSFIGNASGIVIAPENETIAEILAGSGERSTQIFSGTMSGTPSGVESLQNDTQASTEMGVNRATSKSDGSHLFYAGSYWRDELTFTGGVGEFWPKFKTELTGSISDSAGEYSHGGATQVNGPGTGRTSIRYREFIGDRDLPPGDPETDPNFFVNLGFDSNPDPFSDIYSYEYDFIDEFGFIIDFDPDQMIFDEVTGALNTTNRDQLDYTGGTRSIRWEYGQPLPVAYLLETWAIDGGVADFGSTGLLASIEVPPGVTVTSASGTSYNVVSVPEPECAWLLLVCVLAYGAARRS